MKLEGKKIVVTGGSGLVGSNLVKTLTQHLDHCSLLVTQHETPLTYPFLSSCGDLCDPFFCDEITKEADIVFHCAAKSYGAQVMENDPMALVKDNVVMNINMLQAAHKNGVKKFLWLASTTGYPNTEEAVVESMMFKDEPFDKYYAVGWVKRYTETLCKLFAQKMKNPMTCIVLRPTNIYGPGDKIDPAKSHVLSALMRKVIIKQNPIEIWGDGKDEKDVIYVDDMVNALLLAAEKIDQFEQFNIGSGETHTILDILGQIKELAKYDAPYKFIPTGPKMIPVRRVSIEKAQRMLGWKPSISLTEGLQKTYEWMSARLETEMYKKYD